MIGTTVSAYRVIDKLGEGGMGEVYRARDTTLNRLVAIKFLPDAFAHDAERVARFTREAQTLAALNHPNIAQIYGIVEAPVTAGPTPGGGHVHALVMELVEGEDLSAVIAHRPMPIGHALPIARQIAEALEAAHEQGIVHRDLKPANIKVRPDGTVKILDFGLAKAMDPSSGSEASSSFDASNSPTFAASSATGVGIILGTAAYMSPEQAKAKAVDRRADIWAFGVVLYEMLTGRRLFEGESTGEILAAVLRQDIDLAALPISTPARVRDLLQRCLERDPRMRLRDIGEVRLALSSPGAGRESLVVPQRLRSLLSGRLVPAAALAVASFAAGLGLAALVMRSAPTPPPLAMTSLTASGNVISASVSPDGRYVAYVESERGLQSLWLQQVDGGQTLRLVPDRGGAYYWNQTFTPDGNSVIYGMKTRDDPKGALYSISTLGGAPRRLLTDADSVPSFSPDGRRMAFLRQASPSPDQSALVVADADGSNDKVLAAVRLPEFVAGIFFGGPAWSPDGKTIVTAVGRRASLGADASARLVRVDATTGGITTLSDPGWISAAQAQWLPDGASLLVIARSPDQVSPQIWSVSVPGGVPRRVTNDLNDHRVLSLSRDARALVSVAGSVSTVVTVQPVHGTGPPVRVSRATRDGLRGVAFAPDGRVLYSADVGGASSIWLAQADGSDRAPLFAGQSGETMSRPLMVRNGTVFYLAVGQKGTEVRAAATDGTANRLIAPDATRDPISASADGSLVLFSAFEGGVPHVFRAGPDGGGRTKLTAAASYVGAVDAAGRRVAYYYDGPDGRVRIGVSAAQGGRLLADLPAEPPNGNSRLVLTDEGIYLNTVPGDLANVWLQPLDGRPAQRLTAFDDQTLLDFSVSFDGSHLALVRGVRLRDAQLITGFWHADGADSKNPTP